MHHEGWNPEWPTLDFEVTPKGVDSSFEGFRPFEFDFGESSSIGPALECPADPAPGDDGRLISDFWSEIEPEIEPPSRPRSGGARRPEIPGYEILGELGRGAMGVVYRARQVRLNREVALKMILAGDHAGPDAIARFAAEAETIARLKHPHVVQIHAIGDWEGRPYVELEYVEGGSLGSRLDGTPWPPRSAARLLVALARAAGEAHRLGIVHRDLKPANILMTEGGDPKISDFGLAKTLDADSGLTRTESILGSPNYMAPEQADGRAREVGPPADIYALGATLYELLTGRPPFLAPTILATLDLVKNSDPVPPPEAPAAPGSRPRDDLPEVPGEGARAPLRVRRRPGRRRRRLPRRRADPGQAILDRGAGLEVGPEAPVDRRADRGLDPRDPGRGRRRGVEEGGRGPARRGVEAGHGHPQGPGRSVHPARGRDAMASGGEWGSFPGPKLASALTLIHSGAPLAGLKAGVESLIDACGRQIAEQRGRDAARLRLARFQKLYDEAVFYQSDYTGLDPEGNIRAGRASAGRALAEFGRGPGGGARPGRGRGPRARSPVPRLPGTRED